MKPNQTDNCGLQSRRGKERGGPTFSMELMVTPAAQEMMRWRSSMSGPISSRTKGMMCGFTARKSTSLLLTVSLLLIVRFTPILCRGRTKQIWKTKQNERIDNFPFSHITQPSRNVSPHPQSWHSGQVCVWGAGCNPVRSNHTWWGRKEEAESVVWGYTAHWHNKTRLQWSYNSGRKHKELSEKSKKWDKMLWAFYIT